MAVGLVNPLESYARNHIKSLTCFKIGRRGSLWEELTTLQLAVCVISRVEREEFESAAADNPACMNTDPQTEMVQTVTSKDVSDLYSMS